MSHLRQIIYLILGWLLATTVVNASAEPGVRFQVGLSYVSNLSDLEDAIEDNNLVQLDSTLPIGVMLGVQYQLENGVGLGASVGPAILAFGDASFSVIPLSAELRYYFANAKDVSPYVRAGVAHPIVSGDFVDDGSAGFAGGFGIEFGRDRPVSFGVDVGYNASEVTVTATGVQPEVSIKPISLC